jgi:PadR family transcriptional regulator AphA
MDRRPTLSLTEWAILGLLAERARHGYDMAGELRPGAALGDVWRVDRPLVYRAVERLEALGLAEPVREEQGRAGRRRTVYRATRRGRAAVRAWVLAPVEHLRDVRTGLLLKLSLAARLGIDTGPLLAAQRRVLSPRFATLRRPPADRADLAGLWRHHAAAAADAFLLDLERR